MSLRLAITPGEPGGIGFDCLIELIQHPQTAELVAIADPEIFKARANKLGKKIDLQIYQPHKPPEISPPGTLKILPVIAANAKVCRNTDINNAPYLLKTLEIAVQGCVRHEFDALVTGPLHKAAINDAGIAFKGHTEYLAQLTQTKKVVMMLASKNLKVALATTHVPLKDVSNSITQENLKEIIEIIDKDFKNRFKIRKPRILVCGLNPHAGESGHMGTEEIDTLIPVINALKKNIDVLGPVPADTAFTKERLKSIDVVLAMYHDQGLPVIKHTGFGSVVNITLGLPIIRTSVDHGTALDIAGSGKANFESMQCAVEMAGNLV